VKREGFPDPLSPCQSSSPRGWNFVKDISMIVAAKKIGTALGFCFYFKEWADIVI
jgi:hypothetical protein